jgi:hypothetical protein
MWTRKTSNTAVFAALDLFELITGAFRNGQ